VIFERVFAIGREEFDQLAPLWLGEACTYSYMLESPGDIEESEEQGAYSCAFSVLVPAETCDDTVAVAFVLDLQHDAFIRLVGAGDIFCHDSIEASAFEATKPVHGDIFLIRCGCHVNWGFCGGEQLFQFSTPDVKWFFAKVSIGLAEQVEEYYGGRDLI